MTESGSEHQISHRRFDELKAAYCRRCGLPVSPSELHLHDHDDEPADDIAGAAD
ncbi:glycerol dehydrogenase-like iron-containing ADH family enzyme [Agromyces terreus]|uniref:Glycerol dehydrogenase-like iron-containing ADH family enzyme n=1 Tax=Agromyces terreus TaxID=424795 RepID=A0A9X2GYJ3_9MICO|nr:hypothetical protein [Agromyces terreus]MCP2369766.1 glycerol dehydrogenase-like iron-containing ADH family enzyme [Agromyces terreus]